MKRQQHTETSGPLSGHVRRRRRFLSPLAAIDVLTIGDWVRDDLPDLLWPVLALAEFGSSGAIRFVRWQKSVQDDLAGRVEPQALADGLDGRLTSLDRLVEAFPEAQATVRDRAVEHDILPTCVARVLASYPERPAVWLVDLDLTSPGQPEVDLLARAILEATVPFSRRGWDLKQRRELLSTRRALALGLGTPATQLCAIPLAAIIVMPVAFAAAYSSRTKHSASP